MDNLSSFISEAKVQVNDNENFSTDDGAKYDLDNCDIKNDDDEQKNDEILVQIQLEILFVSRIDIDSNSFDAIVETTMEWRNHHEARTSPDVSFYAATGIEILFSEVETNGNRTKRTIRHFGKFHSPFSLLQFPFDIQNLIIIAIIPRAFRICNPKVVLNSQASAVEYDFEISPTLHRVARNPHVMGLSVHIRRKYSYYLWNVPFILFLLGSVALGAFFFPIEDLPNRVNTCVTIFLSILVMMQAGQMMKLSFLTFLQLYYMMILAWIFLLGSSHIFISTYEDYGSEAEEVNYWMCWIMSSIWLVFHFVIGVYFYVWRYFSCCSSPFDLFTSGTSPKYVFRTKSQTQKSNQRDLLYRF